jgi:D-aminopeptidase
MNVLISADGEGVSGITSSDELVKGKAEYERFRHLMTADVNAAIEGAAAGGATGIIVNDSHWGMNNILPEELDPRADLVRGFHKPLCMMHGVDDDIDTVFCVGYHAMVGHSDGVANETMIGREMIEIRLNGRPVGELDINATIARRAAMSRLRSRNSRSTAGRRDASGWIGAGPRSAKRPSGRSGGPLKARFSRSPSSSRSRTRSSSRRHPRR